MEMDRNHPHFGQGVDARQEDRPGVPMETVPRPIEGAHWAEPERQHPTVPVLKRALLDELTPVFSSASPPRGLSGAIRRAAYRVPEHRARHWMMLLFADRVDVFEDRLGPRLLWLPVAVPALLAGAWLFGKLRPRRRFRLF